jgi:hypothetical protein
MIVVPFLWLHVCVTLPSLHIDKHDHANNVADHFLADRKAVVDLGSFVLHHYTDTRKIR